MLCRHAALVVQPRYALWLLEPAPCAPAHCTAGTTQLDAAAVCAGSSN